MTPERDDRASARDAQYALRVKRALVRFLGEDAANTILFYTKEPEPVNFPGRLRAVLGNGAEIVLRQIEAQTTASAGRQGPAKPPRRPFDTLIPHPPSEVAIGSLRGQGAARSLVSMRERIEIAAE